MSSQPPRPAAQHNWPLIELVVLTIASAAVGLGGAALVAAGINRRPVTS